jgi:uncharacterized protein YjiS (DUF1127 family)
MKTVFPQTISSSSLAGAGQVARLRELGATAVAAVDSATAPVVTQLFTWIQRARDRNALQRLDEHMLHDIGISRADVDYETSKPFWRA